MSNCKVTIFNYHKSELVRINMEQSECEKFVEIFQCALGQFPMKYLGLLLHFDKLRREDLQPLVDNILKRMSG